MLKKTLILFGIILVIILIFNNILMPWYVKHADLVDVPNVIGLNYLEAKKILEEAGLDVKQADVKYDETKPIGQVLDQNPLSNEKVKKNRRIYLTLCGGEQLIEVPKLIGKTVRDAKFTLEQRNLKIGEIVKKFTAEYPEDFVVSQIVQPGSKVKKSTKIDLIISNGQKIGDIIVPDLIGKKLQDARKLLEERKLKVGKITYQSSDIIPGQVIDQYPKKEKSAKENTPVDLFISKKMIEEEKSFEEGLNEETKVGKGNIKEPIEKDKKEGSDLTKEKVNEKIESSKPKESPDKPKEKIEKPKDKGDPKSNDKK